MGLFDRLRRKTPAAPADPRALFLEQARGVLATWPGVSDLAPLEDTYGLRLRHGGKDHRLFLDNLFAETRELSPEDRVALIRQRAKLLEEAGEEEPSWEEARPRLLAVLRAPLVGIPDPYCREVLPCLREHLVLDSPESMAYVRRAQLERWQVGEAELLETAYQNLRHLPAAEVQPYQEHPSRIWSVESGDDHESSRLLLPGFLAAFAGRVDGAPIAVIPERSMLYVAGDADPRTVIRLCDLAEREYAASPRNISSAIYTTGPDGALAPYRRAIADEAALRVQEAHVKFAGSEYGAQKAHLEQMHAREGVDLFVASFGGIRKDATRPLRSWCSWAAGVDSLLPETDLVAVGGPADAKVSLVRWDELMRLAGSCLKRAPGLFPPRWRTVAQLTKEQLAALAEAATALE